MRSSKHPLETIDPSPIDDSSFPAFDSYQEVEKQYTESDDKLFNADHKRPHEVVLAEKPEHRLILYLKLNGMSNKQIAKLTGYTVVWVRQIVRQPWFQKKFTEEAKTAGIDAVEKLLQGEVLESVEVIRDLRDDRALAGSTRLAASRELLDRYLGKPTQKVVTDNTNRSVDDVSGEASAVDTEIKHIEESLKSKGVE